MKSHVLYETNLDEFASRGEFLSVTDNWKNNNTEPKSFKLVVLDTMEGIDFGAGDSYESSGAWSTNIFTDGKVVKALDDEINGVDINVTNATYLANEHHGGYNGKDDNWFYTVYTSDEDALEQTINNLGGYLGLFDKKDCEITNNLSTATIYKRAREKRKSL